MNTYPILTKNINGDFRNLTSTECKRLRALGFACSESTVVRRRVSEIGNHGLLFKPNPDGGYSSLKIAVTNC